MENLLSKLLIKKESDESERQWTSVWMELTRWCSGLGVGRSLTGRWVNGLLSNLFDFDRLPEKYLQYAANWSYFWYNFNVDLVYLWPTAFTPSSPASTYLTRINLINSFHNKPGINGQKKWWLANKNKIFSNHFSLYIF